MNYKDLIPDQRKQLIEFYKAMKMAAKIFPKQRGSNQTIILQLADQVIEELKKENPDENKIQDLAAKLKAMANPFS